MLSEHEMAKMPLGRRVDLLVKLTINYRLIEIRDSSKKLIYRNIVRSF